MESERKRIRENMANLNSIMVLETDSIEAFAEKPHDLIELIRSLGQAVILCDQDWRIVESSRGAETFLGEEKETIKSRHLFRDVFSTMAGDIDWQEDQNEFFIERYQLPGKGSAALKVSLSKIAFKGCKGYYMVFVTDVSDLFLAQQTARNASIAKSRFVAHISHEIRTPLLGILGFCERLSGFAVDENHRESLETIESCANQLLGLVNSLLDISKIESQKVEVYKHPFSLRALIKQVTLSIQPALREKNLSLELDIEPSLPVCLVGDELKIRQVLSNLLVNAIKYTDSGGIKISVRRPAESFERGPHKCLIGFSVADSGIGVPEGDRERIFEPFVQMDKMRKDHGSGLGLAICKQLVDAMGGVIWCESNRPHGSLFSFNLPLEPGSENGVSERKGEYNVRGSLAYRPTILLAEDIKVNRKLIQYMLEDLGCKVIAVENGERCVALLDKVAPDLILMDMQMPVLNGYEATRIIRQTPQWSHIPIIALTAYAMNGDVEKCMEVGCNYYLSKPFNRGQLYTLVDQCLGSRADNYIEIS